MKRVPRCSWLTAVFCQQSRLGSWVPGAGDSDVLSAGLSVTYHTEILQTMIMQKGADLQPFNVQTLVTHLVNVFSLTQMYD